jgi:ectoine hydroxylase-related dioxygenase (phytanoyl-CoA dioxygenase family)
MAAQLVGNDLILWGTTIFGKPARCGKATPWHQDGDYYPIRPLETISIWIALDDVTPENGPMRFIPGSHKARKIFSHHWEENKNLSINKVCDSEHYDESIAHDLLLKAGEVSFHDVYMIHGSKANNTDQRRTAFVVRIMPGHCHYDHEFGQQMAEPHQAHDYGRRPLFLIRGRDTTGKNNFSIGH